MKRCYRIYIVDLHQTVSLQEKKGKIICEKRRISVRFMFNEVSSDSGNKERETNKGP
jgi:hypothetical protein